MLKRSRLGEYCELMVKAKFIFHGFEVFPANGHDSRADFIAMMDGEFYRVQVKSGRLKNGKVVAQTCSRSSYGRRDYRGNADLLAIWCIDTSTCYLLPVSRANKNEMHLRVSATKNNQLAGVKFANDYQI